MFAGPRWAKYTAEFVYVGGNEDFEVRTSPWGAGVGLDHFLKSDLTGHDTTYTADGVNINPREDYDREAANEAVDQPGTAVLLMLGIQMKL